MIRALENELQKFKEGRHYLISVDSQRNKVYTIFSNRLKKAIAEIEEVGHSSPLLNNALKIGDITVKVINKQEESMSFSNQEAGSLEDLFLRDKARERREQANSSRIEEVMDDRNTKIFNQQVEQQHPKPASALNYDE